MIFYYLHLSIFVFFHVFVSFLLLPGSLCPLSPACVKTQQTIDLELFKPSEDAESLVVSIKENWEVLDFNFLWVTSQLGQV